MLYQATKIHNYYKKQKKSRIIFDSDGLETEGRLLREGAQLQNNGYICHVVCKILRTRYFLPVSFKLK